MWSDSAAAVNCAGDRCGIDKSAWWLDCEAAARSADLPCFTRFHPPPLGLLLHLPSVWKRFHLAGIVSHSVPAFPPNCFLSSPLLPPHPVVSIRQKVRLLLVIRLLPVLLSCQQPLSDTSRIGEKISIIILLKTTDVLNIGGVAGQWPESCCKMISFWMTILNECSG